MKDSNSTYLNVGKFAPFFSLDNVQDLEKTIAKGVEEIIVSDFVRFSVTSVADDKWLVGPKTDTGLSPSVHIQVVHSCHSGHVAI